MFCHKALRSLNTQLDGVFCMKLTFNYKRFSEEEMNALCYAVGNTTGALTAVGLRLGDSDAGIQQQVGNIDISF